MHSQGEQHIANRSTRRSFAGFGALIGAGLIGLSALGMYTFLGVQGWGLALSIVLGIAAVAVAAYLGGREGAKAGTASEDVIHAWPSTPAQRRACLLTAIFALVAGGVCVAVQFKTKAPSGAWMSGGLVLIALGFFALGLRFPGKTIGRCVLWAIAIQGFLGLGINLVAFTAVQQACADRVPGWLPAAIAPIIDAAIDGAKTGAKEGVEEGITNVVAPIIRENEQLKNSLADKDDEIARLKAQAPANAQSQADGGDPRAKAAVDDIRATGDFTKLQALLVAQANAAASTMQPSIDAQVARIREIVAIASGRGDWITVEQWADKGLALAPDDMFLVIVAGDLATARGQLEKATALFTRALDHWKQKANANPADTSAAREYSVALDRIGDALTSAGRREEALRAFEQSKAIAEKLAVADPGNAEWQRNLSVSWNKIGDALTSAGRREEALRAFEQSKAIREKLAVADPGNAGWQRDLSVSWDRIGDALTSAGRREEALRAFEQSKAIREKLAVADPGNAEWQRNLSVSWERIGLWHKEGGDVAAARTAWNESRRISAALVQLDPGNAIWKYDLAWVEEQLAALK